MNVTFNELNPNKFYIVTVDDFPADFSIDEQSNYAITLQNTFEHYGIHALVMCGGVNVSVAVNENNVMHNQPETFLSAGQQNYNQQENIRRGFIQEEGLSDPF